MSGDRPVEDLEASYRSACMNGAFGPGGHFWCGAAEPELDELPEEEAAAGQASENPCFQFLEQVRTEADNLRSAEGDPHPDDQVVPDYEENHLTGAPDLEQLNGLLNAKNSMEAFRTDSLGSPTGDVADPEYTPKTLREALLLPGNYFNKLFRFMVHLRCGKGGADFGFLKNPRSCRRASRGLNWYQLLESHRQGR